MNYRNHYKKIFVAAAALFIVFAPIALTNIAFAAGNTTTGSAPSTAAPSPVDWLTSPATSAVYYVALTVDKVMTLAVVAGAFFVRLGLQFNGNIFNSPEVQTGFSVTLAIANLGFVLAIIIIAIATILRNQTYGIKQLLWKLVFMAILVNFGLVIMAPIVGFADSMSSYFINATSPSNATGGYEGYVSTMAQAFAPQTMTPANSVTAVGCPGAGSGTGTASICNLQTSVGSATQPGSPDSLTQEILSMFFGIVFLAMTAFTFFCLAALLVIRYLMLAGLLIVLPLAWLTYVFPKFDNSFSKWWNTFVKWTLFPPLALFFIYLAFTTAANTGGAATQNAYLQQAAGLPAGAAQGPEGALVYQTGLGGAIQQAADEILLVGLTIMGLMFALSLSGKAGSTVVNGATTASKAAAGYVGKKGLRVAGRAVPQKLKENLQAGKVLPFGQRLQVATGVGLGNLERKGRGDVVAEEAKHAEALAKDPASFARILSTKPGALGTGGVSNQRQMAMLAQLAKDEDLQKEVAKQGNIVGGEHLQDFLKKNEGGFKKFQQEKVYETLKDKSGLTPLELAQKSEESEKAIFELGPKEKLQEVKDLMAKSAANGGLLDSETDAAKVRAYKDRKEELEYLEKEAVGPKADLMTHAERGELANMRTMESTPGEYMTDAEKAKYQEARDSYEENSAKLKSWVTKNPDTAAEAFQDHDKAAAKLKAAGKPAPLTFDPAAVKRVQQSILTAMADGFSPQNAKGLIEAIGKKNNLKYFEEAMDKMDEKTSSQIKALAKANKPLKAWIQNNPGRNIVDLNRMFGIRPKRKKGKDGQDNDES